jgi:hypothetical protein
MNSDTIYDAKHKETAGNKTQIIYYSEISNIIYSHTALHDVLSFQAYKIVKDKGRCLYI